MIALHLECQETCWQARQTRARAAQFRRIAAAIKAEAKERIAASRNQRYALLLRRELARRLEAKRCARS